MSRSNSSTERIDTSIYEQNFRKWISDWLICKPTSPKDREQQTAAEESSNSVLRRTWQGVKENQQAKVDQTPLECDTKLLKVDMTSIQASLSDLRQIFLFPTQDIHWGYYQTKQEYFRPANQRSVNEKTVDSQLDNLFSDIHAVVSKMFKKWQLVTDGDSTIVTSAQSRDDRKKFGSRNRFKKKAIQLMDIAKQIIELKPGDGSHTGQTEQFLILLFESSETDIGTKLKALSVLFYTYVMFNQSLDRILCLAVMLRRLAFDAQYSHAKISRSAHDLFMTSLSNLSRFSIGEGFKDGNSNSNRSNSSNKNAADSSVGGSCFEKIHKTVSNHRLVEDVTQLHKKPKEKLLCKFSDHFLYCLCRELDRLLTEFETGSFKIARIACSEQNKNIRSTFVYIPFVIHKSAISSLSQILKCCTEQIKHATSPESHSMQCYCSMIFLRLLSTNMNNSNFSDQLSRTSLRSRQVQYEEVIHQLEDYCQQDTLHTPELVTMLGHECSQVPLVSPLIYFLDTVCSVSTAKLSQSELTLLNDERGNYYTRACVSLLVLLYPDTGARDGMYLTHLQRFLFDLLTNGLLQYSSQLLEQAEDPSRLVLNERFTNMLSLIALLYISVSLPIVQSLSSHKLKSLVTGVDTLLDIIKKTPNCDGKATLLHMLASIYCDCASVMMWRDVNRMWLSPSHVLSHLPIGAQVTSVDNVHDSNTALTFSDNHRKQLTSFICSMWHKYMDSFYSSTVDLMSGFSHSDSELFDLILQCLQSMLITQIHHTHNYAQINVFLSRLESLNLDDEFWKEYETIWRFILDFFVCLDHQTLQFQIGNLQEACNYLLCLPPIDQTKDDALLFTEAIPRFQKRFFPYLYRMTCIERLETMIESRAFSWKYVQRLLRHKLEGDDGRMKQHLHGCIEAIMQQAPSDLSNSFACYSLSMYSPATEFSLLRSVADPFQECYTELIHYFDLFHNERSTIQVVTTTVWFDFLACRVVFDSSSFSVSNHDIRALFYNLGCDTLAGHCGATYHPSIRHCPIPHEEKLASMRKRYLFFVLAKLLISERYCQQACDTLFDMLDEIPMVVHNSATCDQKLTLLGVLYFMLMIVLPKDENIKPGDVVRFDDGSIGIISHIDTINGHHITTMSIDNTNISHHRHNRYRKMTHHDSINEFKTEHSTLRDQLQQQFISVKLLDKLKFLLEAETECNSSIDYVAMMKTCITKVLSSPNLLPLVIQVPNMTKLLVSLAKKPLNFLYYQSAEKANRPNVLCCCGKYLSDDGGIRLIDLYELYYRMPHDIQSLYAYLANVKSFQDAMMGLERRRNFREIFEYLPSLIMHRPDLHEYYHINKLTVTALGETPAEMLRANYTFPSTCQVLSILVSVEEATSESFLSFGLAPETHNLNGLPGWFNNSMGYHSDGELHVADQFLVGQSRCITTYDAQSPLAQNDVILFMYDRELRRIDVSRNGITILSDLCPEISVVRLFPVIQVSGAGTRVTLSFPLDATKWIRNVDEASTAPSTNNEALLQHGTTIGWVNSHEKESTKPDSIEVGTIMKIVDEHENRYAIVVDMMKKQMQVATLNPDGKVQLLWVKRKQLTKNNNHPLLPPNISIEQKDRILRQYYVSNPVLYARELLYNVLSRDTTLSHLVDIITDKPVLATLFSLFVYDNISRMDMFGDVAQNIQSSEPTTTTRDFFNQFFLRSSANVSKLVSDQFHNEDSVIILRHILKLIDECLSRYISQDGPYCRTFASTKMTHCTEVFIPNAKGLKIHLDRSKIALFEEDTLSFSTRRNFDFTSGEGYELSAGVSIENRTISSNKVYFRFKKSPSSESRYAFKVTPTGISFRNEDAVIENIWANPSILLWAVNILTRVSEDQRVRRLLVSRHESDLLSMIHKSVQYLLQVDVPLQSSMTHLLQILCRNVLPHCSNKEAASGLWPRIRSSLDEYQLEQANDIISILDYGP